MHYNLPIKPYTWSCKEALESENMRVRNYKSLLSFNNSPGR